MSLTLSGTGALTLPSGSVLSASPATGLRSQALATMQKFADEFEALLTTNGYQKLPSGLIIQWGNIVTAGTGLVTWTYPIAFPTVCASTIGSAVFGGGYYGLSFDGTPSLTSAPIRITAAAAVNCRVLAIGY